MISIITGITVIGIVLIVKLILVPEHGGNDSTVGLARLVEGGGACWKFLANGVNHQYKMQVCMDMKYGIRSYMDLGIPEPDQRLLRNNSGTYRDHHPGYRHF